MRPEKLPVLVSIKRRYGVMINERIGQLFSAHSEAQLRHAADEPNKPCRAFW